ncbi:MAG: M15 family metallopeptidase [Spirochaetales bacterium]|nr:M15 family metallopeptidase [Spirochaetales bacterium]
MKKALLTALIICVASGLLPAESGETAEARRTPQAVLSAFLYAYPEKIGRIIDVGDDWTIEIGDSIFLWSEGRFLPEDLSASVSVYTAHPFYSYAGELPPIVEPSAERKQQLEERINNREKNPPRRHPGIYNAIWRIENETTAWNQAKTTFMFGHKLTIHRDLLDELAAIEEELVARAAGDRELRAYVESIRNVEGYSWRRIAETGSLSYHSYGAAVDFLPGSAGGKGIYWLWRKEFDPQWYLLPYANRHMPPASFVEAFEKRGFVWGGKWFYYDTMHFEFRPEILAVNGWLREERQNPVTGVVETIWVPPGDF